MQPYRLKLVFAFLLCEVNFLSQDERMSMPAPKLTSDGKFVCEADKSVFDSMEDYDRHIMAAHTVSGSGKTW